MPALAQTTSRDAPEWIAQLLRSLPPAAATGSPVQVRHDAAHSNDIFEVTFADGRVLLIKRARHEWVRAAFRASTEAARLLAAADGVVAPLPLTVPAEADTLPVQAYWRIPLPTLAQLWPGLSDNRRAAALRSLGRLSRRLHGIAAPGWGALSPPGDAPDMAAALDRDLRQRLLPAVIAHWPDGIAALERLIDVIPAAQRRVGDNAMPALLHCDLHLDNVLCRVHGDDVVCTGFLDLDGVAGGVPAADYACFDVLHGTLFQRHIPSALRREIRAGSGQRLDPWLLEFFRCAHLANQGFSSALLGHADHAATVARELRRRLDAFGRARCSAPTEPPGGVAAARLWH